MSKCVYVHSSGDRIWSPSSKEDLCNAVQELTAEVERLRNEVKAANSEVSRLKDRLALLGAIAARLRPSDGAA